MELEKRLEIIRYIRTKLEIHEKLLIYNKNKQKKRRFYFFSLLKILLNSPVIILGVLEAIFYDCLDFVN